nr:hypothetical protein HK105_000615 [Polyrhizophydium stewartii]
MVQKYSSTGFDIEYSRVMNTIVHLSCGDLPYLNDAEFLNLLSVTHGLIRGLCPRASSISGDPQLVGWKIASRLLHAQGIIRQVPVCGIIFFSIMAACGVKEMTAVAAGYGILPATLPSAEDSKVRLYIKIGSYLCVKYYETRWMRSIYDDCTKAFNSFGPSTELYEHAGQFMNSTRTTWYHIVPARISIPIVPIRPPVELACRSL